MKVGCHAGSFVPVVLALALSGCETDGAPRTAERPGQEVQDREASAGSEPIWALEEQPRFSVTGSESDPEFYFVIPRQAGILNDGSTIILDWGAETLVYLDPSGVPTRVVGGRPGEGPGEFQALREILAAPGDSGVWAWDSRLRRLSHFDHAGDFLT